MKRMGTHKIFLETFHFFESFESNIVWAFCPGITALGMCFMQWENTKGNCAMFNKLLSILFSI